MAARPLLLVEDAFGKRDVRQAVA